MLHDDGRLDLNAAAIRVTYSDNYKCSHCGIAGSTRGNEDRPKLRLCAGVINPTYLEWNLRPLTAYVVQGLHVLLYAGAMLL